MKYHHITYILAGKMKSEITEQQIEFSNMLKCVFGKTNEVVKIIDVIRDHSKNIINNIASKIGRASCRERVYSDV